MSKKELIVDICGHATFRAHKLFFTLLILALPVCGFAKMYEEPKSFSLKDKSQEQVQRKVLPKIDAERLLEEDNARPKNPREPGPTRFAVPADVAFTLENSGTWQDVPEGRLWRLRIHSPGAKNLNLGITRFDIPEKAKLWIYDPEHKQVEGPYTIRNRSHRGSLWTPIIEGDEIVVEVFVPAGVSQPVIEIRKANQGFRNFRKSDPDKNHGACNNDVICPEGDPWRDQIRSVARYTINGTSLCTGQLINNTAQPRRHFFLSANHCGVSAANDDTLVFFWNFEAPNCGDQNGGSLADNQTGSIFRASSAPSDFLLVELSQAPDAAFNVFYTGWDASGGIANSTVGIHHPRGDVKSISFNTNAVTSTDYLSDTVNANEDHWRVDDWEDGTTEGGSSGSCLWDVATHRCIGQLHGGFALCTAQTESDWYGKLSVSWTGGGTAATRLQDWLDAGNTGVLGLDGDTHITTIDGVHYDFQAAGEFVSLRDGDGSNFQIQTRMAAIATTFNPGADPHDGLATCVSLNTAVAARVGKRRVTYEPNLSGEPDPSGLQLRVDGVLTKLGPTGLDLGNGGRLQTTAAPGGLAVNFPDGSVMNVTPGWWASQSKWYLNVSVFRPHAIDGAGSTSSSGTGGIAGAIVPGSWLPALPDGSSMGPMPGALHQRYVDLYQKFGKAWRVTDDTSLFDYSEGTSTDTFTMNDWPLENPPCKIPQTEPVEPATLAVAEQACQSIKDKFARRNCIFDVQVTGNTGFGKTYALSQRIQAGSTTIRVSADDYRRSAEAGVIFTAIVSRNDRTRPGAPTGTVVFMVDGERAGEPVRIDKHGVARSKPYRFQGGKHKVSATYAPSKGSEFLGSTSNEHTVGSEKD